jgi:hypothetical protein
VDSLGRIEVKGRSEPTAEAVGEYRLPPSGLREQTASRRVTGRTAPRAFGTNGCRYLVLLSAVARPLTVRVTALRKMFLAA